MKESSPFAPPKRTKIAGHSSVITHSFASGVIPSVAPTEEEIAAALEVLGMDPDDVRCAYYGDPATEWNHLNAIIRDKMPTGYYTEIHNLVPSCGKCNQSKRNEHTSNSCLDAPSRGNGDTPEMACTRPTVPTREASDAPRRAQVRPQVR